MPHYRFTPQQIATLTTYLQTKTDSDYGSGRSSGCGHPKQIAHGRKLIVELGCAACHEINGVQKPDNFAPDLSTIGSKPLAQIVFLPGMEHSLPSYIVAKIRQPRAFGSSVKMPQFALTASQTDAWPPRCLRSPTAAAPCLTRCVSRQFRRRTISPLGTPAS